MKKTIAFVAFCMVAGLSSASAQTTGAPATAPGSAQSIDDIRTDYRIHAGPFYVNPALLLKELGVDTNVFNAAGEQKSDFTFTLTPQADVAVPFARRGLLRATVGTDVVYYATYDSERSLDPSVRVRAEGYARRLTLFAEGDYLNTRQRPNYEIDLRSRHVENNLLAGAGVRLSSKLSFELAARRGRTDYDADATFDGTSLQQTLNRETSGGIGAVRYRLSPLTTIGVKFDRLEDVFEYSPLRDSRSYRVMPGVEFKPRALVSGTAWVGYRSFTPNHPESLPEFSGLVADLGLSYTLLGSTTFGVSYHRDLTYSYEVNYPFFVDNSVGASVRRALGGRFDAIVSADRHNYEYEQVLTLAPLPIARLDTTWVYGANLGYRMRRDMRIGFGARYYQRDSTTASFVQFDGLRFGATVNYGF
jgi:hypothetical protein